MATRTAAEDRAGGAGRPVRRRENTRARLLEAATAVFTEKGFASSRIDDIVAQAGFTRGAFYSNFSTMDELFLATVTDNLRRILDDVEHASNERLRAGSGPEEVLVILDDLRPQGRVLYALTTELTLYVMRNPDSEKARSVSRTDFTRSLSRIIEQGLERVGRRPLLAVRDIADFLIVMFMDSISAEEMGVTDPDPRERLHGIATLLMWTLSEPADPADPHPRGAPEPSPAHAPLPLRVLDCARLSPTGYSSSNGVKTVTSVNGGTPHD
ncbi:MAG: TetR/AcrR family transcriptional regulator [Actinomyces sp.]|jgi:AcrR family transcriptional regulator|nr:TetR/AcrR family transcriptional regulator [Actinomyces sp.]MCI1662186.1 TetR/AcrR family transcriptional regulator [Actinomyces sp.]